MIAQFLFELLLIGSCTSPSSSLGYKLHFRVTRLEVPSLLGTTTKYISIILFLKYKLDLTF
jgi:hypothetical protein